MNRFNGFDCLLLEGQRFQIFLRPDRLGLLVSQFIGSRTFFGCELFHPQPFGFGLRLLTFNGRQHDGNRS